MDAAPILLNRILVVAFGACFLAQALKVFWAAVYHRKVDPKLLTTTGGMPSSHSALVAALAVAIGETQGWQGGEFAIAAVVAIIVMYDAAGVRQAAGRHAQILNQITYALGQASDQGGTPLPEALGHTPLEVVVGGILGAGVSWLACPWLV